MKYLPLMLMALLGTAASGCLPGVGDEQESIATVEGACEGENRISVNALDLASLNLKDLNLSVLDLDVLDPAAVSALQDPGTTGARARQILRYAAGCALDSSQSFDFTWVDALSVTHSESYVGSLGLATAWAARPLTVAEDLWISACLIARVNWYGLPVMISMRGSHSQLDHTDALEVQFYSSQEGAFWGTLFGSSPAVYSCHYGANILTSRSKNRDCAAGHYDALNGVQNCGIINIVGDCSTYCSSMTATGKYYPACTNDLKGAYASKVITVWLH